MQITWTIFNSACSWTDMSLGLEVYLVFSDGLIFYQLSHTFIQIPYGNTYMDELDFPKPKSQDKSKFMLTGCLDIKVSDLFCHCIFVLLKRRSNFCCFYASY